MIREIVHDPLFLSRPSAPATREDLAAAQDLMDTLRANRGTCVGMAANMIGVLRRIVAVDDDSHAGDGGILCDTHCQGIDVKSPAGKQAGYFG